MPSSIHGDFTPTSMPFVQQVILSEPAQMRMLSVILQEVDEVTEFLDVGANVGVYTVAAARAGAQRITALEPSPDTFEEMLRNIRLNDLHDGHDLKALRLAASDTSGTLTFEQRRRFGTGNRVLPGGVPSDRAESVIAVPTDRLDAVISADGERSCFAKIDVEGHEQAVLAGAAGLLERRLAMVQVEIWPGSGRQAVHESLKPHGFELLLRMGGDHLFVHHTLNRYRDQLSEVFWRFFHQMYRVSSKLGKLGHAALDEPAVRDQLTRIFNGHAPSWLRDEAGE